MMKFCAPILLSASLALPAVAQDASQERSFIYAERMAPSLSLASFCSREQIEAATDNYNDVIRELRSEADENARSMGFARGGTCYAPQQEAYGEMYTLLFTMGSHVLYLTPDEIDEFRAYKEAGGRESDTILQSDVWPAD